MRGRPSIRPELKAYIGQQQRLAVAKLLFPEAVIDLILQYGCKVNDYLLLLSTPSHDLFDVWAMWADIPDISWGLNVRGTKMRFLGSWFYLDLLSEFVTGPRMTLTWTEAVVETIAQDEDCVGWGELRHYEDQRFDAHFRVAVALGFWQPKRLGNWLIDGENSIPLIARMSLV